MRRLSCGLSVPVGLVPLSRPTSIMLRVRTSCELIWLACMETLLNDVPRKTVILLGDINDELLVTNACTFLVNDVVSLDPLGPV